MTITKEPLELSSLVVDEPFRFRVDSRIQRDDNIFRLELARIFGRTWQFVAHESEVAVPGDYRTTVLAGQPVIVSRGEDGRIHVVLNRCMHRGAVVCRSERGHGNHFRCPYHNWVYRNDGALVGMAQRAGYGPNFEAGELDLVRVPRVDTYRGLIFACLDPDASDLEERLGPTAWYIDQWADRSPHGSVRVTSGVHRYRYPGNWKFQVENGIDGYHGNYVHESFVTLLDRSGERRRQEVVRARNEQATNNHARSLANGDSMLEREEGMLGTFDYAANPRYRRQLEEAHGADRVADILTQRNLFIFPNLYLFESHIRVIRPLSATDTIVDALPTWLDGIDDDINTARLREHERFFGPSSFGATDDIEIFVLNQTGVQATAARWLDFSRGLERERRQPDGSIVGHSTDEVPQRALYRTWFRMLQQERADG
ncbi:aromatic ring-hydroxylating dioxygenase subunit alpha [Egicoccus sp. AB-alg2]|uniref:aromatic ring-hydroxylating oxygenase subunit alpha n=1 Tax=Egicoccus sp. AB-alg2 TaxID=3242693 RepID=UPI00359D9681